MKDFINVFWRICGCFVIIGSAICGLIGLVCSVFEMIFNYIAHGWTTLGDRLRVIADSLSRKEFTNSDDTEDVSEEFSWIAES